MKIKIRSGGEVKTAHHGIPIVGNNSAAAIDFLTTVSDLTALPAEGMRFGDCNGLFMQGPQQILS
jgi:hypothetical protein